MRVSWDKSALISVMIVGRLQQNWTVIVIYEYIIRGDVYKADWELIRNYQHDVNADIAKKNIHQVMYSWTN